MNDPDERNDLIGTPDHRDRVREMKTELEKWFVRYVDPTVDGTHEPVAGKGQLGLAGPAGKGEKTLSDDWHYLAHGGTTPILLHKTEDRK